MDYFDDICFKVVVHRYFSGSIMEGPFVPGSNSLEMIRSGSIYLSRNGGEKILLEGPVLFWMREGNTYEFIRHIRQKRSCEHVYFDCTGPKSEKMLDFLETRYPAGFLPLDDSGKISALFFEMVNCYRLDPRKYLPELSILVDSVMLEIVRIGRKELKVEDDPYRIRQLGDEIRKNPFQDFDFTAAAAEKSITRYHLARLFRSVHKMPPCEFVHEQRMIRAAELLRLPGMRIKEVMLNCSYNSLPEFSRAFKKYSSLSPREYQKKHLAVNPGAENES